MRVYKLTDSTGQTRGKLQWGPGVTHAVGQGRELCSDGWLHFYEHPLLAILHNPIHGNFRNPLLWESWAEGEILKEGQMKAGCKTLTTVRQLRLPAISATNGAAYAILTADQQPQNSAWRFWANQWLTGEDRTRVAAYAVARAAANDAAYAAAYAAYAANAANAASAANDAAYAATYAAYAAGAAYAAARSDNTLNLVACAQYALRIK